MILMFLVSARPGAACALARRHSRAPLAASFKRAEAPSDLALAALPGRVRPVSYPWGSRGMASEAAAAASPAALRRVVMASMIGTTIEWYDFFVYGLAAAPVFK